MKVLIIDNYDSFTYNLYQYVGEILEHNRQRLGLGDFSIIVKRNNEIDLKEAEEMAADRIIISPGPGEPGNPDYFGVCSEIIMNLGRTTPLLGVCLGMQGIAHCFGASIVLADIPMHGKVSTVVHDQQGIFVGLPQGLEVMRYHSLVVKQDSLPECLQVTSIAVDDNGGTLITPEWQGFSPAKKSEIMAIRHNDYPIEGIQFHPESFKTEGGMRMLENFLFKQ